MKIAVWFSCGAASAVAAKLTIEKFKNDAEIHVLNNPVKEEHIDNRRFLKDVEKWINHPIETVKNSKFPNASAEEVWKTRGYMSGVAGAPCTLELKKAARQEWENKYKPTHTVLGFTIDEINRHERFVLTERELIPILISEGLTKQDCFSIVEDAGIELPEIYKLGYPNANCIGCVKASSVTYWNHVRVKHPKIFEDRAQLSDELGVKLVRYKGERISLRELPPDAKGRPMKNLYIECGIFCEET